MRWLYYGLLGVLLLPGLAGAWDAACGDANGLRDYLRNRDPSEITAPDCFVIPEETQAAQRTFLETDVTIQTNGRPDIRKVRVMGGLAAAKTQGAIDAINAADAAVATDAAAKVSEVTTNTFCSAATLAEIKSRIATAQATGVTQIAGARAAAHTQVASLPGVSLAQVKAALDGLVDRLYDGLGETNTNLYQAIDKLASCMFARIGTP